MSIKISITDTDGSVTQHEAENADVAITLRSTPTLPLLDQYLENMITYGTKHATNGLAVDPEKQQDHALYYQGNYDRIHVMHQIADKTGDALFRRYANELMANLADAYADKAFGGSGYRNYNLGIVEQVDRGGLSSIDRLRFIRTAILIGLRASYAPPYNVTDVRWTAEKWGAVIRSRETALAVYSHLLTRQWIDMAKELLPQTGVWNIQKYELPEFQDRYIAEAVRRWILGVHIPQWIAAVSTGTAHEARHNWAPFMMGLTARSLIRYHDHAVFTKHNDQIVDSLADLASVVYPFAYRETGERFGLFYRPVEDGDVGPAPDLSLLVFPWFAWLWQQTREQKFHDWACTLFESGVRWAWLDGGKQFNQSYLWSREGIEYLEGY